jgi:hypothetical protein
VPKLRFAEALAEIAMLKKQRTEKYPTFADRARSAKVRFRPPPRALSRAGRGGERRPSPCLAFSVARAAT